MNIFQELKNDLAAVGQKLYAEAEIWSLANVEASKDPTHGDISSNVAMIIASQKGKNPRLVAAEFKELFEQIPYVEKIEIAGPGFINFTIKAEKWHECISAILSDSKDFWQSNIGAGEKVNVEYVSANPTGPMHIGHARGAVFGDVLANILQKSGYEVTKEYYINDAGSQIDTLVQSAFLRYKEAHTGQSAEIPEGLYPGEYLKSVGEKLAEKHQGKLLEIGREAAYQEIRQFTIDQMMQLIKADLAEMGVHHDVFFSEKSLHDGDKIEESIDLLRAKNLIYKGTLPAPKGKVNEGWEEKEQMLFKSTDYGDDQDRPVQKSDGSWTYLAADFAYAKDKIDRGFQKLVYILGADHSGYIKRIKAVIHALSDGCVQSDIRTNQLVNFVKSGQPVKMSKRSGNFMTVRDVSDEVGRDIIRFIMLTRRSDMVLDFDFDKVKEQSKDNPVFYVQYAHVRTKSILNNAKKNVPVAYDKFMARGIDLSRLITDEEIQLIKSLAAWPKVLSSAAMSCEPQKIAYYLIDVASKFHSIWNLGKENNNYRFNIEDDIELTVARLALAEAIGKVIAGGFEVMGVVPMNKM